VLEREGSKAEGTGVAEMEECPWAANASYCWLGHGRYPFVLASWGADTPLECHPSAGTGDIGGGPVMPLLKVEDRGRTGYVWVVA
jgi:hypothetical protein